MGRAISAGRGAGLAGPRERGPRHRIDCLMAHQSDCFVGMKGDRFAGFREMTTILERDSKDTTYKFALLRGVIEISQEHTGLGRVTDTGVEFPLGLLVEKWILYYYPLIEPDLIVPQQRSGESRPGGHRIAFRNDLRRVTEYYRPLGGLSAFYRDYVMGAFPQEIEADVLALMKRVRSTITGMPMRYLGRSLSQEEYSIFTYAYGEPLRPGRHRVDQKFLIAKGGTFSFRRELFEVFQYLGSYIAGEDSLLYKWAEFSANADKNRTITTEKVLELLKTRPETGRAVLDARSAYSARLEAGESLECVWSGRRIERGDALAVDHAIPFSLWRNNELWNLLPASNRVNARKRDMIPSPSLIDHRADAIVDTWHLLHSAYPARFMNEMAVSLIGKPTFSTPWEESGIEHLRGKCEYLIDVRGLEAWRP